MTRGLVREKIPGSLGALPGFWAALLFISNIKPSAGRDVGASANLDFTVEIAAELGLYFLVGLYLVLQVGRWPIRTSGVTMLHGLALFAVLAAWSSLISDSFLLTLVRSSQLLLVVVLAWFTRGRLSDAGIGSEVLLSATGRIVVWIAMAFTTVALVLRLEDDGRLTWPGMGAGVTSLYLAVALIFLLDRAVMNGRIRACAFVLLGVAFALTETRSTIVSLVVGLATISFVRRRARGASVAPAVVATTAIASLLYVFREELLLFAQRGQNADWLTTLNGRVPLWRTVIDQIEGPTEWAVGHGYGTARFLQYYVDWAGSAHNAFMQALYEGGMLAVVVLTVGVYIPLLLVAVKADSTRSDVLRGFAVLLAITALISEALTVPGVGFVLLCLLAATVTRTELGARAHRSPAQPVQAAGRRGRRARAMAQSPS